MLYLPRYDPTNYQIGHEVYARSRFPTRYESCCRIDGINMCPKTAAYTTHSNLRGLLPKSFQGECIMWFLKTTPNKRCGETLEMRTGPRFKLESSTIKLLLSQVPQLLRILNAGSGSHSYRFASSVDAVRWVKCKRRRKRRSLNHLMLSRSGVGNGILYIGQFSFPSGSQPKISRIELSNIFPLGSLWTFMFHLSMAYVLTICQITVHRKRLQSF